MLMLDIAINPCDYIGREEVRRQFEDETWMDEISAPASQVGFLGQQLLVLATDIRELRKEIAAMRAPDYKLYISWVGLVIVGGAALWTLAIQPIQTTQKQAEMTF